MNDSGIPKLGLWMMHHPTETRLILAVVVGWTAWNVFGTGMHLGAARTLHSWAAQSASENLGG
jgi:hypothetical protein